MKRSLISFVFAIAIILGSCSTSRDVRVTEREERDDGTVVKRERRVDDDGIVIKKSKRDREIFDRDEDDRDTEVRIRRERRERNNDDDDDPAIIIERDRR